MKYRKETVKSQHLIIMSWNGKSMLLFGKPLQGFRHPSLQTPFEAENGYQENQWLECLVLLGQEWMDKMARRVPHYINILGKHHIEESFTLSIWWSHFHHHFLLWFPIRSCLTCTFWQNYLRKPCLSCYLETQTSILLSFERERKRHLRENLRSAQDTAFEFILHMSPQNLMESHTLENIICPLRVHVISESLSFIFWYYRQSKISRKWNSKISFN